VLALIGHEYGPSGEWPNQTQLCYGCAYIVLPWPVPSWYSTRARVAVWANAADAEALALRITRAAFIVRREMLATAAEPLQAA
jgi:hypothetical protein